MSETKHTPGMLRVGYSDGSGPECLTIDDNTVVVMGGDSFGLMYGARKPADAARIALTWNCHDELVEALRSIAEHTDPDGGDNYRSDDREGCLDTVHALARAALSRATPREGNAK